MDAALPYVLTGLALGLGAGLTPGPLMTLVISETLQHDLRDGAKVALAPLLTDLPIVAASLLVLSRLTEQHLVLGTLSLIGALFLAYLAYENLAAPPLRIRAEAVTARSLRKGMLANVLNPAPYLFWATIGGPTTLEAAAIGLGASLGFVGGFYGCLVGSKLLLAVLVERARGFFHQRVYRSIVRVLGLVLLLFAFQFLREALIYWDWW